MPQLFSHGQMYNMTMHSIDIALWVVLIYDMLIRYAGSSCILQPLETGSQVDGHER